ncbi:hypothetical protein FGO68_gene17153 [Halteria grandinella]|uniref:Uncharacterized protein n=1 Tax=Halteria grandinella TaxID=5974 RepID=A0A8J8NVI9_HALGN|nr:hypothetical protein FGO68_gene17153 [Halteria grandinella]
MMKKRMEVVAMNLASQMTQTPAKALTQIAVMIVTFQREQEGSIPCKQSPSPVQSSQSPNPNYPPLSPSSRGRVSCQSNLARSSAKTAWRQVRIFSNAAKILSISNAPIAKNSSPREQSSVKSASAAADTSVTCTGGKSVKRRAKLRTPYKEQSIINSSLTLHLKRSMKPNQKWL